MCIRDSTRIDHYITTHWHRDHVGGIALLAKLIPVKNFYDHGIPATLSSDINAKQIEAYRAVSENKSTTLKAGDEIKFLSLSLIHISEPTRLLSISYAVFCL